MRTNTAMNTLLGRRRLAAVAALLALSTGGAWAEHPMGPPMGMPGGMAPAPAASDTTDATADAEPTAPLPGFSGSTRIYHLGATGFFLDHPEHIALSAKQRKTLETVKADAQTEQAGYQAHIRASENELWSLTGSDSPDAAAVEQKVREIERLRGDQRIAYIHAVGEAAETLSDDQRAQLTGRAPPNPEPAKPAAKGK